VWSKCALAGALLVGVLGLTVALDGAGAGITDNVYAIGNGTNSIYQVNLADGSVTSVHANYPIAPAGQNSAAQALRASDGMMFYIAGTSGNGAVYRWNPATPATAPVLLGQTGAGTPYMPRLAFNSSGTLYGMDTNGTQLYTINTTTGAATPAGAAITGAGSGGGDMAFNPANGVLYLVSNTNLYTIPLAGGAATNLGAISGMSAGATGVAFRPSTGELLVSVNATPSKLYTVNLSTRVATAFSGTMTTLIGDMASVPRREADLQVTKSDGVATYVAGGSVVYSVVVTNAGPSDAGGAVVTDAVPAQVASRTWTCAGSGGAVCPAASGSGALNATVATFPAGGAVTYTVTDTTSGGASGALVDTATAAAPSGVTDPVAGNNSATDTDSRASPVIGVAKSSTTASVTAAGQVVPYTFTVTNAGNVTLTAITVADPKCSSAPAYQSGDTNADSKLQLAETWIYTCNRTVTQAEVDAGGNLANTVTADSAESPPATSTLNIPITQSPAIHVVKSSTTASITATGQVVPYTFTVTNTGNVTLTGITVADPKCNSAPAYSSGDANADLKLQLSETWVYTCSHTVTQAEVDAGGNLSNTVTADSVESAPATSTKNIPVTQSPSIQVVKSSTTVSVTAAGQVVPYTFTVTNPGNTTLTGITVADPKCNSAPAYSSGDANADLKLQRTETWVYTCNHTVTQAEVDAGGNLSNTVTADSTESAPATSTLNIPVTQSPSIHVVKSSTTAAVTAAGQVVPYTFTVTSTGNVTLTAITVADARCNVAPTYSSGDTNADSKLQLAETWVYTCNHTVTQAEVDAGGNLSNTVTADSAESAPATSTKNIPVTQSPTIHVVKSSTAASVTAAGQVVPYTFTVTNTGNVTLTAITVADPKCNVAPAYSSGDTNADSKLQLAETWVYTCSHTVTQAEVDAGGNLSNTVTADSAESAPATSTKNIPVSQSPSINVVKSSTTASVNAAGQVVPYTFTVTNTGNVTLTGITVADPRCNAAPTLSSGDTNADAKLQLAETWVWACNRTVTQAEVDAGGNLSNTVTADSAESAPATSTKNIPITQSPSIHVVKSSTTASIAAAGQVVPYTFTVTNSGNVTLTGITVSDPRCNAAPAYSSGDANADSKLQLAETWVYACSHTVTQAEVDAGGNLSNTVTADSVESAPATSTKNIPITSGPSIHVVKSSPTASVTAAGQVVPYTFTVTNPGNVTLTAITVADPKCNVAPAYSSGDANSDAKLQQSETWLYTCSHTVTQAEVDAGGNLSNTVSADSTESVPATDTVNIPVAQSPSIQVVKSSTTVSVSAAGQVVPYTFTVTNMGNVTLTGITVADAKCNAAPAYSSGDANADSKLQLSETWVYTCSHTVTQAEVDAGGNLSNTVTADSAESVPATGTLNIPVAQSPSIHVVKSSTTASVSAAGQVVPYTFTVTNTGNVTLSAITVSDPKCASPALSSGDTNTDAKLQLSETWVYTCSHTVTQAEVDAGGNLSNTVTAYSTESAPATSTKNIPVAQSPSIHVVKSSTTLSVLNAGQVIPYTFTVTNTGNVTLTGITVSDPKCNAAPSLSSGDANGDLKLQLSESWAWTCNHTVTQAEVDAGGNLSNTVTADSTESAPATATLTIPVSQVPAIHVVKSSTTASVNAAGQVVPYTFTVTNTGNVTLTGITVADPRCNAGPAYASGDTNADTKLQPSETWSYACTHTVTQAEVDAGGNLSNTATADSTESAPDTSTKNIPVAQSPSIQVVKASTTVSVSAAGQVVPYSFTVTNTGNVTLTGITVTDPKCNAAPAYASGDTNADTKLQLSETWVYTCGHTVTQAELDAGGNLSNTVTADSAESPPATSTLNIPIAQSPAIHVVKASTATAVSAAGQVVPYTLTVTNTGNVTLTGITVADPKCNAAPTLSSGDANADSKLQLAETWVYACNHTATQAEIDAGGNLSNTATADSTELAPDTSTKNIPVSQSPSIHVVKSSTTASINAAGQVVPYTFTVTNTGNVTLTGITVSDSRCDAAPGLSNGDANADSRLQLSETWVYTCSHTVSQADVDAGGNVSNTVTADSLESAPATDTLDIPVAQSPSIDVVKSSTTAAVNAAAQVVPYTFTVTNTGNTTLTGITVDDPKCDAPPALASGDANADGLLQLAESWVYTCTHTVSQAEVDAGGNLSNTVTAYSTESAPATSTKNIPITQSPSIHVVKSSTTASVTASGQVVPYRFTITNTGNVTLTGVTVTDPTCNAAPTLSSGDVNADAKVQLAETWIYTCSRTVTQAEVDAGGNLSNTVTVDSVESAPAADTLNIPIAQSPALGLAKAGTLDMTVVPPPGQSDAGDRIDYALHATNTGNVTVHAVTITDPLIGALTCAQPATLAPGASLVCTGSYTLTAADVTAGQVANTAHVDGLDPGNNPVAASASKTVPLVPAPSLAIVKHALPATYDHVGQVIAYSYDVTNDGNTILLGPFSVDDDKTSNETCPPTGSLSPGSTITCTSSDTIAQADLDAGFVTNVASATNGSVTSPTDTVTVNAIQSPQLTLAKAGAVDMTVVAPAGRVDAGDRVDYTLTATNAGNVTLHNVAIADAKLGALTCPQPATRAPGATLVCTGSYTVTQADVDAGHVDNTAVATSTETPPVSTPRTVVLPQTTTLRLQKSVVEPSYSLPGDLLHYHYLVTNTGNTSLAGPVTVADTKAPVLCPPVTTVGDNDTDLDPGEALDCTATYTVTAGDVAAGSVSNVAHANAGGVQSPDDAVTVLQAPKMVDLAVTKTSAPAPYVAGNPLTYTVRVTNNGPDAVAGATLDDTVPAAITGVTWTCAITTGTGACGSAAGAGNGISTTVGLTSGSVATLTVHGTVDPAATGVIANTATAATPLGVIDPTPANNSATDLAAPTSAADAAIAIAPTTAAVAPGAPLSFTVTVSNNGPASATGVQASVLLPPGYGFGSAAGTGWACSLVVSTVTCGLAAPLGSGAAASPIGLSLTAPAGAGHTALNASVTTTSPDLNPANDHAAATVDVTAPPPGNPQADLAVVKTGPATATTSGQIAYTLAVANTGPDDAQNVVVVDTLPAGVTLASVTGTGWTCSAAGSVVTCNRPVLAAGASAPVQVVVTARSPGSLANSASVSSSTADPNPGNNTSTATTAVSGRADLVVTKKASGKTYLPGQPLTFTVTVANHGPDDVTAARVHDAVPAGITGVTWTCAAVAGRCVPSGSGSIDEAVDIAAGGQAVFTVVGRPSSGAPAVLANTAGVTVPANVTDPDTANDTATASVARGVAPTLLRVLITPKNATLRSGVPVDEVVTTKNVGTQTARGVTTCVTLPPGVTIAKASGGFPASGSYCWRTRALAANGAVTFRFAVRGDRSQVAKVKLVAVAQARNAPRVDDHSKLVVKKGPTGGRWVVFTG
jgi:uncharacterized repeat protein (TIGR01451 family)